ncbi:Uma2 family endonuclease [Streptomyces alboflavus]|uniref:Uma2 family endonuclease n=1 Tax=Streptomyces alboflavus TaxID=67267 RepID=UPI00367B25B5
MVLDPANGLEPDVSVLRRSAVEDWHRMTFPVADVLLAVEVVSPDSLSRDSTTKPQKYAAAGIPHFWLVEMAGLDDHAVVRVYERGGASGTYALTGIHRGRLKLSVPYDIDIDLTAIDEL